MTPATATDDDTITINTDELARAVASDDQLRNRFEAQYDAATPDHISEVLAPSANSGHEVLSVVLRPELAEWVRRQTETGDQKLADIVRNACLHLAHRVLVEEMDRPPRGVCPAEPGTRTERVSASMPPAQRTVVGLAADRWETPISRFGAEAVDRYREALQEAE